MASMYFPIKNHGGIPIMTAHDGGIVASALVTDTQVGKMKIAALPHLIANTVDNVARGLEYAIDTTGETSLISPSKARKLVRDTKIAVTRYEELTDEEREARAKHKKVGMRHRSL